MYTFKIYGGLYSPTFDQEYEMEVSFDYFGASKGTRGPHGEPLEPDEDAEVSIIDVVPFGDLSGLTKSKKELLDTLATLTLFSNEGTLEELAWEHLRSLQEEY